MAEKDESLRLFILYKIMNLQRAAVAQAPVFKSKNRRTRQIYVESAVERCSGGWQPAVDIHALPPSKIKAKELEEGARRLRKTKK